MLCKDFQRRSITDNLALMEGDDAAALSGLMHEVGDENDSDALSVQAFCLIHDSRAVGGVEHGGALVEDDALRLHGEHAGQRQALGFPGGEEEGMAFPQMDEVGGFERRLDPLAHLTRRQAEVGRPESNLFLDGGSDDLVLGALKDEADAGADGGMVGGDGGVQTGGYGHASGWEQQGVEQAREGAFAGAIGADQRDHLTAVNAETHLREGGGARAGTVRKGDILQPDEICHGLIVPKKRSS